jgi:hypothetical protein
VFPVSQLGVGEVWPLSNNEGGGGNEAADDNAEAAREVLRIAALASRTENQDPIDMALLLATGARGEAVEAAAATDAQERANAVTKAVVAMPETEQKLKPAADAAQLAAASAAEAAKPAATARAAEIALAEPAAKPLIVGKVVHFKPFDAKTRRTEVSGG